MFIGNKFLDIYDIHAKVLGSLQYSVEFRLNHGYNKVATPRPGRAVICYLKAAKGLMTLSIS